MLVLAFKNHRVYKYIGNKDLICAQRSPIFMCVGVLKCEQTENDPSLSKNNFHVLK